MSALDYLARHRAGGAPAFVLSKVEILGDHRDEAKGHLDGLQEAVDRARRDRESLERERARLADSLHGRRFHAEIATDIENRIEQTDEALEVANAKFEKAWQKLEAATDMERARGSLRPPLIIGAPPWRPCIAEQGRKPDAAEAKRRARMGWCIAESAR